MVFSYNLSAKPLERITKQPKRNEFNVRIMMQQVLVQCIFHLLKRNDLWFPPNSSTSTNLEETRPKDQNKNKKGYFSHYFQHVFGQGEVQ